MWDWQTLIVLLCVAIAAGWLGWSTWRSLMRRTTHGCGTACTGCPQQQTTEQPQAAGFVSLDSLMQTTESAHR
ncbi:FeoB-associated Cys-rich membrane protein [bacterium]|nr:FeoB-associated Cys-rich membrane protein [bacterium]